MTVNAQPTGQPKRVVFLCVENANIESMREVGYDLGQQRSKGLADLPAVEFDVAVTMGCGDECPLIRARRREEWDIPDPNGLPPEQFRAVRDLIEQKVKALLATL